MVGALKGLFDSNDKQVKRTEPIFKKLKEQIAVMETKSFEEMRKRIAAMKEELEPLVKEIPDDFLTSLRKIEDRKSLPSHERKIQEKLFEFLPEVFAMLNEVYKRKSGSPFHDVQLRAGIILAQGQRLVEQYTGEGKTRTFQLPLVLYALVGRGAHLVTVNDYLTKVGAEYAGHMISELGISVGVITPNESYRFISDDQIETFKGAEAVKERSEQDMDIDKMHGINLVETTKQESYACDITYGTNNEFGFDYLRDNMAWDLHRLAQRELYFCIIDEADSILIDEARTPLIISATPSDADTEKYARFATAVSSLEENVDYEVDHKRRSASLTESGMHKVEMNLGIENAWDDYSVAYHLENALKAKALFHNDDEYIVRNGEVLIVDEFTGRVLKGRRYSEGLHQAIEAKEGVDIQQESRTYATITFQNFFRLYKILCGGSGTVMTEGEEFYKIYGLESIVIPTNRPNIRKDYADRIFKTSEAKWKAVVQDIKQEHEKGRPVLVGTTSVDNSVIVSQYLDELGIPHEVLNAKFHEQESRIVTKAGRKGAVTVATNMAGRGTDIIIGAGRRGDDAWKEVSDLGGLHVIGTERHDARRIDNQLRGRTGRQGEPGTTRFYVSLEDKIMRVLGGEIIAKLMNLVKVPDDIPIEMKMISRQIEMAQKRVESLNFESRKRVVDYDDVMNQHREIFYTRRRNIMSTADTAMGKVKVGSKVLNTSLQENRDKRAQFEDKISSAQSKLVQLFRDMVDDEVDFLLNQKLTSKQITDEQSDDIVKKIFNIMPKELLSVVHQQSASQVEALLKQLVSNSDVPALEEYLNKVYEFKITEFGDDFYNVCKMLALEEMDKRWVDHLEMMKGIREAVGLQGYAQRDPLVEYQNRAYEVFQSFINSIDSEIAKRLLKVAKVKRTMPVQKVETNREEVEDVLTGDREMIDDSSEKAQKVLDSISKRKDFQQASLKTNAGNENNATKQSTKRQHGRNERVSVRYSDGKIVSDVKYKKVELDIKAGNCEVIS